ncbi:unnamed protein product [Chrysoparadoxa australica]
MGRLRRSPQQEEGCAGKLSERATRGRGSGGMERGIRFYAALPLGQEERCFLPIKQLGAGGAVWHQKRALSLLVATG